MTSGDVVYLDYNATAPLRPEAREAILAAFDEVGNAASVHSCGRRAADRVAVARRQLAELLGCTPGELVVTGGATEANNLAVHAASTRPGRLVTSAVEHPAIGEAARAVTAANADRLVEVPVDEHGRVCLELLRRVLEDGPIALVSVMAANNETGVLTDLGAVTTLAHDVGALVHTDATQMVGRLPIDLDELDVDLLSLSAHKFGGPQGVGALFVRRGIALPVRPLCFGGGQERGWRPGTLNVAGIAGMGAAAAAAATTALPDEARRVTELRDALERAVLGQVPDVRVNGAAVARLPGVSSLTVRGAPADAVLAAMPLVAASDGSACSSGAPGPSHVLLAMGRTRDESEQTLRLSLGHATTPYDVDRAAPMIARAVTTVRSALGVLPIGAAVIAEAQR